jgi:hypothetical protein
MRSFARRVPTTIPLVLLLGIGSAQAVEVPLSRASFDRALEEGRRCTRLDDAGAYFAVKKRTESFLATILENVAQSYLDNEITQVLVTVRLSTPYTRARRAACEASLLGQPLDEGELWQTVAESTTVSIWVETETVSTKNDRASLEDQAEYHWPPETVHASGPRVRRVDLRRGKAPGAGIVLPVSGGGGVEEDFPATALQGRGPFYAIIHTEAPSPDLVLKLKPAVLTEP